MSIATFYQAIGVTPCPSGDDPVVSLDPNNESEFPAFHGYIKFQTGTMEGDLKQADEFEAWLRAQGAKFFRGYPDEDKVGNPKDRRFQLDMETTKLLGQLWEQHECDQKYDDETEFDSDLSEEEGDE